MRCGSTYSRNNSKTVVVMIKNLVGYAVISIESNFVKLHASVYATVQRH